MHTLEKGKSFKSLISDTTSRTRETRAKQTQSKQMEEKKKNKSRNQWQWKQQNKEYQWNKDLVFWKDIKIDKPLKEWQRQKDTREQNHK